MLASHNTFVTAITELSTGNTPITKIMDADINSRWISIPGKSPELVTAKFKKWPDGIYISSIKIIWAFKPLEFEIWVEKSAGKFDSVFKTKDNQDESIEVSFPHLSCIGLKVDLIKHHKDCDIPEVGSVFGIKEMYVYRGM